MNYGIIVAAGKSERMGSEVDKAFFNLGTKPVLCYALHAYERCPDIDGVILVVRKDRLEAARNLAHMFGCSKVKKVVAGGPRRQDSVLNGLAVLSGDVAIVSVHDGARVCVTPHIISQTVQSAKRYGSGVAGVKITDTVKAVTKRLIITKTVDRASLWAVQTPQSFQFPLLKKAFEYVCKKRLTITDEASALEAISEEVRIVPASLSNIKITTPDDLVLAAALLRI